MHDFNKKLFRGRYLENVTSKILTDGSNRFMFALILVIHGKKTV